MGLVDLGFIGPPFTWTNDRTRTGIIRTRIDSAHTTPNWLSIFRDRKIMHFPMNRSDHYPILLKTHNYFTNGHKPFRFETMWMNHADFQNIVKNWWEQTHLSLQDKIC